MESNVFKIIWKTNGWKYHFNEITWFDNSTKSIKKKNCWVESKDYGS